MQKNNQQNVDEILLRLKSVMEADSDAKLAAILGVKPQVISNWKSRKTLDYSLIINVALRYNLNLNWLFTGQKGVLYKNESENTQNVNDQKEGYSVSRKNIQDESIEKVLGYFETVIHQQSRTIEILAAELEHLRRMQEVIFQKLLNQ